MIGRPKTKSMSASGPSPSEVLAFEVVAFIAQDEESLGAFLAATGSSIEDLKGTLEAPETHAALLDFLLDQEPLLLRFCEGASYRPEDIWRTRKQLPGFTSWDSV